MKVTKELENSSMFGAIEVLMEDGYLLCSTTEDQKVQSYHWTDTCSICNAIVFDIVGTSGSNGSLEEDFEKLYEPDWIMNTPSKDAIAHFLAVHEDVFTLCMLKASV